MRSFYTIITLIICVGTGFKAISQNDKRKLEVDDFFKIKNVGNPKISPEGDWIAFTVTETFPDKDKRETSVWMIPFAGGETIRMTAEGSSASNPQWSPDGKYLSFTASRNESKNQVWVLDRRGGEARQITKVKQGINGYEWSPDGKKLVLVIKDPKDTTDKKKDEKEPFVIDRLQFKRDYTGYLDRRRNHLYLFTIGDTTQYQLTFGDYDDSSPRWSPDGKSIAFVSNRTEEPDNNSNSDIWIISTENPGESNKPRKLTTNPGPDYNPAWSPDGTLIAYNTGIEPDLIWYATRHLATIPVTGGSPKILTKSLDRNVNSPGFSKNGKSIFFNLEDSGERHLAEISLDGKNLVRHIAGNISVRGIEGKDLKKMAFLMSKPDRPWEVYTMSDGKPRRITKVNDELIDQLILGESENIHFKSKDGTEIEGFVTKPPEFQKGTKYPALLRIHGGPVSQYDFSFNFEAQLFAAQGYLVVRSNPRGSSGYGQDFSAQLWQAWGVKDFEDVNAAVDHVIKLGYADPDRLGVGGWSYGGILTNYVITKTNRFKAAITGASEVLYAANYGHDHYQLQWEKELGLPWENRELWEKLSPFNYVENIETPTLIMGGEKDWNVPIHNSEQLYQALRRIGKAPTQLVVYPGEHHGIRTPSFQKDRYERYLNWYKKYVKGENLNLLK